MVRNLLTWTTPNFGDALSRWILGQVLPHLELGEDICTTKNLGDNRLLALGSIFHLARSGDVVWGSGLGNHLKSFHGPYKADPDIEILAVRGPLTRDVYLKEGGVRCPEIYGDPAILLPEIYTPEVKCRYGISVLPHVRDVQLSRLFPEARLINAATKNSLAVIDAIRASEFIITSSLHGLIVAESYGIPVVLYLPPAIRLSEPEFKYMDYFASTNRGYSVLYGGSLIDVYTYQSQIQYPEFPDKESLRNSLMLKFSIFEGR